MKPSEDIVQLARTNFDGGFNCAESVFLAGAKFFGQAIPNIPRIATPFGGGLSGCGYTCGAISGGLMVIGLCCGRDEASDLERKRTTYSLADHLLNTFIQRFGSLDCRELSGVDFKTKRGVWKYRKHIHAEVCVPIVEFVAKWLGDEDSNLGNKIQSLVSCR